MDDNFLWSVSKKIIYLEYMIQITCKIWHLPLELHDIFLLLLFFLYQHYNNTRLYNHNGSTQQGLPLQKQPTIYVSDTPLGPDRNITKGRYQDDTQQMNEC